MMSTRSLLVVLLLCCTLPTAAQRRNKRPPPPEPIGGFNDSCIYLYKYGAQERKAEFPYNKASSVLLISYLSGVDQADNRILIKGQQSRDTLFYTWYDTLSHQKVREIIYLKEKGVDSLTDIIQHVMHEPASQEGNVRVIVGTTQCFNPRNAIVFLDEHDSVFAFIDICFQCRRFKGTPDTIGIGPDCDDKYEWLRIFMRGRGIMFGTKPETP